LKLIHEVDGVSNLRRYSSCKQPETNSSLDSF
jgi:hypothetical protein